MKNPYDEKQIKKYVEMAVLATFLDGVKETSLNAGKAPPQVSKKEIKQLSEMTFDLVKGITDEMTKRIKVELNNSILEGETNDQLAKRLENVFQGNNPTRFKYEDRLKMVARTERTRVLERGSINTASRLGADKKYLAVLEDEKTSGICGALDKKYGTKDKSIPIDDDFIIMFEGKEYSGQTSPFHPNCRTRVVYVFD